MKQKQGGRLSRIVRDVGDFDQIVTIEENTTTADSSGGMVETWAAIDGEEWASIEYPLTGNDEGHTKGAEFENARFFVTIRYRGDVTTKNRVTHGAKAYDIINVLPLGREEYEVLTCIDRGEQI